MFSLVSKGKKSDINRRGSFKAYTLIDMNALIKRMVYQIIALLKRISYVTENRKAYHYCLQQNKEKCCPFMFYFILFGIVLFCSFCSVVFYFLFLLLYFIFFSRLFLFLELFSILKESKRVSLTCIMPEIASSNQVKTNVICKNQVCYNFLVQENHCLFRNSTSRS